MCDPRISETARCACDGVVPILVLAAPAEMDGLRAALCPEPMRGPGCDHLRSTTTVADAQAALGAVHGRDRPFAVAFVAASVELGSMGDLVHRLWDADGALQVVLLMDPPLGPRLPAHFERGDQVLVLRKPFHPLALRQVARALAEKWCLQRESAAKMRGLEGAVARHTKALEELDAELAARVSARLQMEKQLRTVQKLQAVGELGAGIAHDLSSPLQYVRDTVEFLRYAGDGIWSLLTAYNGYFEAAELPASLRDRLEDARQQADLDYLKDNVPRAFDRAQEGLGRVAEILGAMKELSHPASKEQTSADVRECLEQALALARNEIKYCADVTEDYEPVPPIRCFPADLQRVFLNILVNGAHAIADNVRGTSDRGQIAVRLRPAGDDVVEVTIRDTGGGIPSEVAGRVFDPFFTTKEVGRGTGQGLAIAHSIVVDKHHGKLWFESKPGLGTTFFIRVPMRGVVAEEAA